LKAYQALVQAMATGDPADFDAIPLGGTVKLANPQAALAFVLEGADSHHLGLLPPPAFISEAEAGEMAEVYWHVLTREVPFSQYGAEPLTSAAIGDLAQFANFSGVDAGNLFSGQTPGDMAGPYLSQFLWKDMPFGATSVVQRYRSTQAGDDHLTDFPTWLNIQNGMPPSTGNSFDPTPRFGRAGPSGFQLPRPVGGSADLAQLWQGCA